MRFSYLLTKAIKQWGANQPCWRGFHCLQEYQSKKLLRASGLRVQNFVVAETPEQALELAKTLNIQHYVIKAQILAGGKGKGHFDHGYKGGVHVTSNVNEIPDIARNMLGHRLITKQTKPEGVMVNRITIGEALDIQRETYFAVLLDRESVSPVMVGSPCGGVDIEEVARSHPDKIFKEKVDINTGCTMEQALKMAENLEFKGPLKQKAANIIKGLVQLFLKVDSTQIEINPLGETHTGEVLCFDCKLNVDANASFRQKQIFAELDHSETDPRELAAHEVNLNYIGLDGNIACLVNGAGLAMATMDIIKYHGGEPANFLDVGGSVTVSQVESAFKILTADPQVKAILVNIFGGIVNCKTIADGIISACKKVKVTVPLIVRLEGTNVANAKRALDESGLAITSASSLREAAEKAVDCIQ